MTLPMFSSLIRRQRRLPGRVGKAAAPAAADLFETLEPRQLLATFTVTSLADAGAGSLRQAVLDANAAGGADVIEFQAGVTGVITLTTGEMVIGGPLSIFGPGADRLTISGNNASRVFRVNDGNAALENVQFSGLTMRAALGAALDISHANVTVTACEISDSVNGGGGGGIYMSDSTVTITDSLISNNQSANGGGVFVLNSSMTMRNCTVSNNRSGNWGGGISRWTNLPSTHVTISNSTITGNTSAQQGGGIYARIGEHTIVSTIIAGNSNSVTLTPDDASFGGHGLNPASVARSTNNLIGDAATSGNLVNGVNGNIVGVDPLLGALAFNGGPTKTSALLAGSPALGMGINPAGLTTDQRGGPFARGASVDIGAFQRQTLSMVVDTLVDENDGNYGPGDLSLREALDAANANPGNDTITFATALNGGTITLGGTELTVSGDVSITGPGASLLTVSGNNASRVINFTSGTSSLSGLKVTGGNPGGLNEGGGIRNAGTLTITNSTISGNTAGSGGGIYSSSGSTLTVTNSTFSGNTTVSDGGAIYNQQGTLTVTNSTISQNGASDDGGAIYNQQGTLTVTNSTISQNGASDDVGGIYNAGGTLTARSTIIAGNMGGDVSGTFESGSTNNLIQDAASAGGLTNGVNGNLVGVNPLLGALADNGGTTRTHALLAGSPAIGAGINPLGLTTDQRGVGFARVRGSGIDIGAFEFNAIPTIASLTPSASSVTRGQSLTLTANTVADADGTIARVDFYRDANANGVADAGELIGSDSDSAGGYTFVFNSAGAALGSLAFLAVAVDNDGGASMPRAAAVTFTNSVPTIASLTASASSIARGQSVTLTANTVADADGTIVRVDFYRDANTNGIADNGELIGSDTSSAGGYTFTLSATTGLPLGSSSFLAVAVDNDAGRSTPKSTSVTVTNAVPTIAGLTASVATLENGDPLTLTAGGVTDPDGTITGVSFFADTNANGVADADELLGTDADAAGGYTYTLTPAQTLALPSAQVIFLAVATDSNAATSAPNSAAATFALSAADQFIQNYLAAPKAASGLVDGDTIVDSLMSSVSNVAVSDAYWGARNHWFQDKKGDVWSLWQGGDVHLSQTLAGQHEWVLTNLTDAAGLSGTMRFAPGSLSGVTTGWNAFNIQGIQDGTLVALWWSPAGSAGTYVDTDGTTKQGSASGLRGNGWSLSSISDALTPVGGAVTTPAGSFLPYSQSQSNGRTEFDPRATFVTANTGMAVVVVDTSQRVYVISFSVSQREIPRADPGLNARWVIEPLAEVPSIADFGLTDQLSTFEQEYVTAATT